MAARPPARRVPTWWTSGPGRRAHAAGCATAIAAVHARRSPCSVGMTGMRSRIVATRSFGAVVTPSSSVITGNGNNGVFAAEPAGTTALNLAGCVISLNGTGVRVESGRRSSGCQTATSSTP